MSNMSDVDVMIKQATGEDYLAYQELTQEVNGYIHGQLPIEQLTLTALGILEEAGIELCPNCQKVLRIEGEAKEAKYCDNCNKFWTAP